MTTHPLRQGRWPVLLVAVGLGLAAIAVTVAADGSPTPGNERPVLHRKGDVTVNIKQKTA